jgi:hypothetical protein
MAHILHLAGWSCWAEDNAATGLKIKQTRQPIL